VAPHLGDAAQAKKRLVSIPPRAAISKGAAPCHWLPRAHSD